MKKLLFALAFALPLLFVKNESFADSFPSDYNYIYTYNSMGFGFKSTAPVYLYVSDRGDLYWASRDPNQTYYYYRFTNNQWSYWSERNQYFDGQFIENGITYYYDSQPYWSLPTLTQFIEYGGSWSGGFLNYSPFDSSIPTLKLYRANTYSYDADLGIRDSKCYIWANTIQDLLMAKFDRVEYKLYVNNEYKATFLKNVPLVGNELNTLITFNYSDYGIVDDDQCSIQARAYKDNSYGLNSSLVWIAVGKSKAPVSSTPNVDTQVPVDGHNVTTITENNIYKTYNYDNSVNETYYDYSQSYVTNEYISSETINNYITNNIQNITNNYYYNTNISVNYGESDGETFKGVRTQFKSWTDDLTSRVQVLAGTPFAPILFTFVGVIGALVAAALIFVLIKIVGLIL